MDESRFVENRIENHNAFGLVLTDSCLPLKGTDYDCDTTPVPEGFPGETGAHIIENNRVIGNVFINNGSKPLRRALDGPGGGYRVRINRHGADQLFCEEHYKTMKLLAEPPGERCAAALRRCHRRPASEVRAGVSDTERS